MSRMVPQSNHVSCSTTGFLLRESQDGGKGMLHVLGDSDQRHWQERSQAIGATRGQWRQVL